MSDSTWIAARRVPRMLRLAFAAALVSAGCHPSVRAEAVTLPNGWPGLGIECRHALDCYRKLSESCPSGYMLHDVNGQQYVEGRAIAARDVSPPRPTTSDVTTILASCRPGAAPTQPQ